MSFLIIFLISRNVENARDQLSVIRSREAKEEEEFLQLEIMLNELEREEQVLKQDVEENEKRNAKTKGLRNDFYKEYMHESANIHAEFREIRTVIWDSIRFVSPRLYEK